MPRVSSNPPWPLMPSEAGKCPSRTACRWVVCGARRALRSLLHSESGHGVILHSITEDMASLRPSASPAPRGVGRQPHTEYVPLHHCQAIYTTSCQFAAGSPAAVRHPEARRDGQGALRRPHKRFNHGRHRRRRPGRRRTPVMGHVRLDQMSRR